MLADMSSCVNNAHSAVKVRFNNLWKAARLNFEVPGKSQPNKQTRDPLLLHVLGFASRSGKNRKL